MCQRLNIVVEAKPLTECKQLLAAQHIHRDHFDTSQGCDFGTASETLSRHSTCAVH